MAGVSHAGAVPRLPGPYWMGPNRPQPSGLHELHSHAGVKNDWHPPKKNVNSEAQQLHRRGAATPWRNRHRTARMLRM